MSESLESGVGSSAFASRWFRVKELNPEVDDYS
jgi:hypothetical protein